MKELDSMNLTGSMNLYDCFSFSRAEEKVDRHQRSHEYHVAFSNSLYNLVNYTKWCTHKS